LDEWYLSHTNDYTIFRYDVKSLLAEKPNATAILTSASDEGTANGMIFGILEDKEGHIWSGTLSGVCRYDGNITDHFKDEG